MKKRLVLIRPLYTEKIARLQESENKYAFEVAKNANKIEIRREIEKKFDVKITSIQTMIMQGKMKQQLTRGGRFSGRRPDWKKAIVTLAEGDKLDLFENASAIAYIIAIEKTDIAVAFKYVLLMFRFMPSNFFFFEAVFFLVCFVLFVVELFLEPLHHVCQFQLVDLGHGQKKRRRIAPFRPDHLQRAAAERDGQFHGLVLSHDRDGNRLTWLGLLHRAGERKRAGHFLAV